MPISVQQLKNRIIIPVLNHLNLNSPSAVNLLLGTCAQESHLGTYLCQIKGPAKGIYQMEPETEELVIQWLKNNNPILLDKVKELVPKFCLGHEDINQLEGNLFYATAMSRILYYSISEPLPKENDLLGLASYWKKFYNTPKGRGTINEFQINYKKYVIPYL